MQIFCKNMGGPPTGQPCYNFRMQEPDTANPDVAKDIVNAYGKVLAGLKHVNAALPASLLPYSKDQIKASLQTLIWILDGADDTIRNSLVQAYVYLEQFISDNKVEIVTRGQAALQSADPQHNDWQYVDEANRIITQIKAAMEESMQDMRLFVHPQEQTTRSTKQDN